MYVVYSLKNKYLYGIHSAIISLQCIHFVKYVISRIMIYIYIDVMYFNIV